MSFGQVEEYDVAKDNEIGPASWTEAQSTPSSHDDTA